MIARYHRHRIASAIFEVTLSAQVTITHQRNPFFLPGGLTSKFRGRSAVSTVLQLLGSFFVLYFPYYGVIVWESSASTFLPGKGFHTRVHPHIMTLASTLLTCSPPVHGLLYGIKSKTLRKSFQHYWRKKMTKCEVNHEIQARTPSACGSRRPSLTPLGLLTRPNASLLQRRLSEAFIDPNRSSQSSPKSKMSRISSELSWRPVSTSGLGLTFVGADIQTDNSKSDSLRAQHAASFSTLQVPKNEQEKLRNEELIRSFKIAIANTKTNEDDSIKTEVIHPGIRTSISNTSLFVQRVLGAGSIRFTLGDSHKVNSPAVSHTRRSPRIMITRAFSEESEPKTPSSPGSPNRKCDLGKKHSVSVTTLICDRKWRKSKNSVAFLDEIRPNFGDSSTEGSTNSSNDGKGGHDTFSRSNGIMSPDEDNLSDGEDSIVWMKTSLNEQLEMTEESKNNIQLHSWPCASNRKAHCRPMQNNRSVEYSSPDHSEDPYLPLRASSSFTGVYNASEKS